MVDSVPVVLWIDDEGEQLRLYTEMLSREGYRVVTATYASAALDLFKHNPVDLVVSDHRLRDCPGADVLGEMKRVKPNVPVILFSGLPQAPGGAELADVFLSKGTSGTDELLATIAKLLQSRVTKPDSHS